MEERLRRNHVIPGLICSLLCGLLALTFAGGTGGWVAAGHDSDDDPKEFTAWTKPVNLGSPPNSPNTTEAGAFISKSGLSLFFAVYGRTDGYGGFDLYVSQRASLTAPWGEPQNLGPNINTAYNEQTPALSLDEHILYFQSDRPGGFGGSDIYASRRHNRKNDLAWQEPVNLGSGVNSKANENGPALFEDDETGTIYLYFGSNRPGGPGGIDIYASTLLPDNTFGPAELVNELNTNYNDQRPSIRRDGLEIFFDSTRPGFGITDLWVSTRLSTSDPWSVPLNLGPLINTTNIDVRPSLSFDGTTLYFHSCGLFGCGEYDLFVSTRTKLKERD